MYCSRVFSDVAQAFDRVWHKLSEMLSDNCRILESSLSERKFRVKYEEAKSAFYSIKVRVPQGSVLRQSYI